MQRNWVRKAKSDFSGQDWDLRRLPRAQKGVVEECGNCFEMQDVWRKAREQRCENVEVLSKK